MPAHIHQLPLGYPLSGLAPKPNRRPGDRKNKPPPRRDRIDLSAPIIYLPPAHPGVEQLRNRPRPDPKPGLETYTGRAILIARCILNSPEDVLAEIRAFSGTVPPGEMERLFEGLNVERLILRAQNRRDPHNRLDAIDRRLSLVAETAGRGRFWLEHQLDWRGFGSSSREKLEELLLRVFTRLCDEHRVYSFARHAVRTHASLHGGTERDALLLLAKAAGEGRVLLEPNGHPLDQAEGVALFLASVHREKLQIGLSSAADLDFVLRYDVHEAAAREAARHDVLARVEEKSRGEVAPHPDPGEARAIQLTLKKGKLPRPHLRGLPLNKGWILLCLCALLTASVIVAAIWKTSSGWGGGKKPSSDTSPSVWFELMRKSER